MTTTKTHVAKTVTGLAALSLALAPLHGRADETTQPDREKVAAQVRQTLKSEGKMSDEAIAAMGREIDKHSGDHGYGEAVSTAVHDAQARDCLRQCLAEAVHQVNHAMDRGRSPDEAARMVGKAVAGAKGTEAQRRDQVRHDMDVALRDRHQERMHDRTQDMAGGAGHGGGGMMQGGRH